MRKRISDKAFLVIFLGLDLIFLGAAYKYYISLNDLAIQSLSRSQRQASEVQDASLLEEIARQAMTGSWETFEAIRAERAAEISKSSARPGPGVSLYFFPETLPLHSFERDFANSELKPGLTELRSAYDTRNSSDAKRAFERLESRVTSFELGATEDATELSPEAQVFLRTYRSFVDMPEVSSRAPSSRKN